VLGRPFRALSGGMKQKLLISLAVATRADLYVLDEPTASLDAAARERFFTLFEQRAVGATLVLCSHRLEEIRHLVDHVVALDEGRVVYDGPAAEYLARSAFSLLEVRVDNGKHAGWLKDRGFAQRPGGWWASTVAHDDKMALLARLSDTLGHTLQNVLVRDLEKLETPAGPPTGPSTGLPTGPPTVSGGGP
jgi:ABC-type multidrug transport system ATPase subunit